MSPRTTLAMALTLLTVVLAIGASVVLVWNPSVADASAALSAVAVPGFDPGMGYLAAALATGLSSLAAGFAVAHVGSAAIGAITEKPELMGRMLILVGLAEGIAIYGLIVSILILNRLG
ncbi:MAG: H+transporting two-sector ATPase C subunit [Magnetococcales bacterium]|nr:H+transporting two-sector ATPase C subunit [Magnetococcales bacterium]